MAEAIQLHKLHHCLLLSSSSSHNDDDVAKTRDQCPSSHLMFKEHDYMLDLAQFSADGENPSIGGEREKKLGEEPGDTDLKLGLGLSSDGDQGKGQCRKESSPMLKREWGSKGSRAELSFNAMELMSSASPTGYGASCTTRGRVHNGEEFPPSKSHIVGWPPIRPCRRGSIMKDCSGHVHSPFFVKVNMDGVPIGRKVNLHAHDSYEGLLMALQEMFHGHNVGSNAYLFKFQLTYEDKDGDWMLVGDVPWEMFVKTVRRLRIMRG